MLELKLLRSGEKLNDVMWLREIDECDDRDSTSMMTRPARPDAVMSMMESDVIQIRDVRLMR